MSQEAVPEQTHDPLAPEQSRHEVVPGQARGQAPAARQGAPRGLLQQMEELMAALNADLTRLDADLQQSALQQPDVQRPCPQQPVLQQPGSPQPDVQRPCPQQPVLQQPGSPQPGPSQVGSSLIDAPQSHPPRFHSPQSVRPGAGTPVRPPVDGGPGGV
ncbi:hypothetical protein [Streptomyces silvensis]|uniref:Uncharacterized protein n=1 Tax=Streptomyces silvensis TaxID=1765722 RepID=A0A0W7X1E8_9ACTN|nr:hypothetical protein [Streptomyces silvensis]KUF16603.1 hypothetical protein AT728_12620 [Streptomyces silvensis]